MNCLWKYLIGVNWMKSMIGITDIDVAEVAVGPDIFNMMHGPVTMAYALGPDSAHIRHSLLLDISAASPDSTNATGQRARVASPPHSLHFPSPSLLRARFQDAPSLLVLGTISIDCK